MVIKRTQDCLSLLERGTGVQQPKGALALGKLCTPRNSVALSDGHHLALDLTRLLNLDAFTSMDIVLLLLCWSYTLAASSIIAAEMAAVEA